VAHGSREVGAERVQLVVQVLAGDLALGNQTAAVADGIEQRIEGPALSRPPSSLASEGDQGGAIAVVVLEATGSPAGVRAAWVSEGAKRRVEPGRRRSSSATQGRCSEPAASIAITVSSAQLGNRSTRRALDSLAQRRQRDGLPDQAPPPSANSTQLVALPGSIATTSVLAGSSALTRSIEQPPSLTGK
jgi:hypothetical protein